MRCPQCVLSFVTLSSLFIYLKLSSLDLQRMFTTMKTGLRNLKTTYTKSWPANLLKVSNLIFSTATRLSGVIKLKNPYISHIIDSRASAYESNL